MEIVDHLDQGRLGGTAELVTCLSEDYPAGSLIAEHDHERAQLLFASVGVMRVQTRAGIWVVPPQRGVWIPTREPHQIYSRGRLSMRTLFIHPHHAPPLGEQPFVLAVSALLREVILECVRQRVLSLANERQKHLFAVLLDELRELPVAPLHLPLPGDERLQRIVSVLLDDPSDDRPLEAWSREAAASSRHLERLFRKETGMTFAVYRQQTRLLAALERLAGGESVIQAALAVGYQSPSAFSAMFRRALGQTPREYFSAPGS